MRRNAVIEQLELAFFKSPAILNQLDANGDLNLTREEFVENMRRIQATQGSRLRGECKVEQTGTCFSSAFVDRCLAPQWVFEDVSK